MTLYLHTAPAGEAIDYTKIVPPETPLPGPYFVSGSKSLSRSVG
jgi:hypothetical protein